MATKAATAFWAKHRPKLLDLVKREKSTGYIAATLGITLSQACNQIAALRKAGVLPDVKAPNAKVIFTAEMDAALTAAMKAGGSFKDYGAAAGISAEVIRRRAVDLGLKSSHVVDIDWAVAKPKLKEMREAGASWRNIAASLDIAESTCRRVGSEIGLPKRLPREAKPVAEPRVRAPRIRAARPTLPKLAKPVRQPAPPPRPKRSKLLPALAAPAAARAPLPSFTALAAEREPVDLVELEPGMCRWPYGDRAPFKFCGCRVSLGSYCPAHAAKSGNGGAEARAAADRLYAATKAGGGFNFKRKARA